MNTKTIALTVATSAALLLALTGCGGEGHAEPDPCLVEAGAIAAAHEGQKEDNVHDDYELMNLCDRLTEWFEGDEGRVVYAVQCIGERAEEMTNPESMFVWPDDITFAEVMNDPMTSMSCV